jgi:hypothetical protein
MSKVKAVAATFVFMLCASGSYAQAPAANGWAGTPIGQAQLGWTFQSSSPQTTGNTMPLFEGPGLMYVACWAEVPSHNTAYFTAPFPSPTVYAARKEFRQLVTTQYGVVGKLQCAGKFNETVVNEQVEKWKDSARSKSAIVDTNWQPVASLRGTLPGAQAKN